MMKSKKSTPTPSNRVLGIDPGFDRCGTAILQKQNGREKLLYSACIVTSPKDEHGTRLKELGEEISRIIKGWKPSSVAIEKLFFNINARTALKVAEARGVIIYEASRAKLPVYEYSPQDVKIAVTGYGKAEKRQVESMALKILGVKTAPKYDDEADAIAMGITHLASHKSI